MGDPLSADNQQPLYRVKRTTEPHAKVVRQEGVSGTPLAKRATYDNIVIHTIVWIAQVEAVDVFAG